MENANTMSRQSLSDYGYLMTVIDVAELLGVSLRTVYRLAEAGELPCVKIGRRWYFPREQFGDLLAPSCQAKPETV